MKSVWITRNFVRLLALPPWLISEAEVCAGPTPPPIPKAATRIEVRLIVVENGHQITVLTFSCCLITTAPPPPLLGHAFLTPTKDNPISPHWRSRWPQKSSFFFQLPMCDTPEPMCHKPPQNSLNRNPRGSSGVCFIHMMPSVHFPTRF